MKKQRSIAQNSSGAVAKSSTSRGQQTSRNGNDDDDDANNNNSTTTNNFIANANANVNSRHQKQLPSAFTTLNQDQNASANNNDASSNACHKNNNTNNYDHALTESPIDTSNNNNNNSNASIVSGVDAAVLSSPTSNASCNFMSNSNIGGSCASLKELWPSQNDAQNTSTNHQSSPSRRNRNLDSNESLVNNNNNDNNNNAKSDGSPNPRNTANSIKLSVIERVTAVLLGEAIRVDDPNTGKSTTVQLSPEHRAANCVAKIVAAGREILFQKTFGNWQSMKDDEITQELEKLCDERESARSVAACLIELQTTIEHKFADAGRAQFNAFANWTRSDDVIEVFVAFARCLTATSFNNSNNNNNNNNNNNTQSVMQILKPLVDIPESVGDFARLQRDWLVGQVPLNDRGVAFRAVVSSFDNVGCSIAMNEDTATAFAKRFVPVPVFQQCRLLHATRFPNRFQDDDQGAVVMHPHFVHNVVGGSGSGKTINSMLQAATFGEASATGSQPGLAILLDTNSMISADDDKKLRELSRSYGSDKKLRNALCAVRFLRDVCAALSRAASVKINVSDDDVATLLPKSESFGAFLQSCCGHAFRCLGIGKKIVGRVVLVADEIGKFSGLHRGLSSCWDDLRLFLQEHLQVELQNLFLFAAGTGTENVTERAEHGSVPGAYAIWTPDSPRMFADSLEWLKQDSKQKKVKVLAGEILSMLYREKTPDELLNDDDNNNNNNNSNINNLSGRASTSLNTSLGSASKFVLRQDALDTSTYCFARMVTYNCRCAGFALQKIVECASEVINFEIPEPKNRNETHHNHCNKNNNNSSNRNNNDVILQNRIRQRFGSHCFGWASSITNKFLELHSLGPIESSACKQIAEAIRVVMWRRTSLTDDEHTRLCVESGLLEDRARFTAFVAGMHDKIIDDPRLGGFPGQTFVIKIGTSRYRVREVFVAMFLNHMHSSGVTFGEKRSLNTDGNDLFELATADQFALVAALDFADQELPVQGTYTPLPEPLLTLSKMQLRVLNASGPVFQNIVRFYCQDEPSKKGIKWLSPTHPEPEVWDKWREIITKGGCVVIVNGSKAPFADVIVLALGRVFLIQCKNFDSASTVKVKTEFDKMLMLSASDDVRAQLAKTCQSKNKVEFIATIVVLSTMARVKETPEAPKSRQINGITWSFVNTPTVYVLDEKQNRSIYSSFLYPVLCTRIQKKPEMAGTNAASDDDDDDDDTNNNTVLDSAKAKSIRTTRNNNKTEQPATKPKAKRATKKPAAGKNNEKKQTKNNKKAKSVKATKTAGKKKNDNSKKGAPAANKQRNK